MIAGRTVAALRPNSWPLISVLSALMAFGPISTDLYVGTFPAIAEALGTDVSAAQLTLTLFLLGVGVAQLFVGALSDRVGRRPVLIGGLLLFIGCAVACALATSITELVILRFFQAIGSCTPVVLSRAIVRDLHERADSARVLGYVGGFMGMVPIFAPVLGGYLVFWFVWSATFWFMAGYCVAMFFVVLLFMQETLSPGHIEPIDLRYVVKSFGRVLRDRTALAYGLPYCFAYAGMFALFTGFAFIVQDLLHYPQQFFGIFFGIILVGYMVGALAVGRLSRRIDVAKLFRIGTALAALSGVVVFGFVAAGIVHIAAFVIPMFVYLLAVGFINPIGMALVLAPFPEIAGKTSALLGGTQMAFSASASLLVSELHDGTAMPVAAIVAISGVLVVVSHIVLRPRQMPG